MRIAVVGGSGTIGRRIVAALGRKRHEVRVLSRHSPDYPVDLTDGDGLEAALKGCEVVVDASNGPPSNRASAVLVDGSRRLLTAERLMKVRHHVCLSIVGIEKVPMAYYRIKLAQEEVVEEGGVPWSIVRATQVHELIGAMLETSAKARIRPTAKVLFQPVSAEEVARVVARVATGKPLLGRTTVAGPEVQDVRALGRIWRDATGRRMLELPVLVPGAAGRALRKGGLTLADPDVRGKQTFAEWLRTDTSRKRA